MKDSYDHNFYINVFEPRIKEAISNSKEEILKEIQAVYHCNNDWLHQRNQTNKKNHPFWVISLFIFLYLALFKIIIS